MASYQARGNTSNGNSFQVNGPIYGSVNAVADLQPGFFKTSEYERHKNISPKRVPDTCLWFLEHSTFQRWKTSRCNDLLWLSADPGCGKSVLSRALIDEQLVSEKSDNLCYFFFKDNEEQNNAATALCALLHQLLWRHDDLLQRHAGPAVKKCGEALKTELEELWRAFVSVASDSSTGNVICILDALDECQEADRNRLIQLLEDFYMQSSNTATTEYQLKFLVTSRPYGVIERKFGRLTRNIPTIRLAGEEESEKISDEIGVVIKSRVKEIAEICNLNERLQSSLQTRLDGVPNRTYLWLHLTLNEVESRIVKGKTEKKLLSIINTLSNSIEDAYERILANCDQEEARKTLKIIVAAQRPLTLRELDVALEIEPKSICYDDLDCQGSDRKDAIRENCGLFVSIVDSRVFLIHQTAREFLICKNNVVGEPRQWKQSINLQEGNRILAEKCVTYLLFREFQQHTTLNSNRRGMFSDMGEDLAMKEILSKNALLEYAANHWISHVQRAEDVRTALTTRTTELCDTNNGSFSVWFPLYSRSTYLPNLEHRSSHDRQRSRLYWAVTLGLVGATDYFLSTAAAGSYDTEEINAVFLQAMKNPNFGARLATLILECCDADIQITQEVVIAAAGNGGNGKEIMTLLLNHRGADVQVTQEVVVAAARNSGNGEEVIALLIDRRGADVQVTQEVVIAAARNGGNGKEVMALLLNRRGVDVQITQEVVVAAAENYSNGKEIIVLLLNRHSADVQITQEVVIAIVQGFNANVVTFLLDRHGVDVHITQEVVVAAAGNRGNGKEIMALLLNRRGVDVQITQEVVVAAAGNRGNGKEIIALLLDRRGADVQITQEVVVAAARNGGNGKDIIALLLDRGVDVQVTQEVVVAAAQNGGNGAEVMALLLNRRGAAVQITQEVVIAAAENYSNGTEIMALLLDRRGADVHITQEVVAAAAGHEEILALLLQQRAAEILIPKSLLKTIMKDSSDASDMIRTLWNRRYDEIVEILSIRERYNVRQEVLSPTLSRVKYRGFWIYLRPPVTNV